MLLTEIDNLNRTERSKLICSYISKAASLVYLGEGVCCADKSE